MTTHPAADVIREKARPLPASTGTALIWRSFFDLKLASVLLSLRRILAEPKGNVLEVGCGNQPYRFLFKDASYRAIDHLRSQEFIPARRPDVTYYEGDVFPVDDNSQDFVFHSEVLEHVEDPELLLRECHRVLRPDGCLLFTAPLNYRFHYIPYDYFRYTPSGLQLLLAKAGFRNVAVAPQGTDITTACHKILSIFFRWLREDVGLLPRFCKILLTAACLPLLAAVHIVGLLSLLGVGSPDDPLGYRVLAYK
jgi:SAM-dependent methyltransferase